jgi:hypothetical protein
MKIKRGSTTSFAICNLFLRGEIVIAPIPQKTYAGSGNKQ